MYEEYIKFKRHFWIIIVILVLTQPIKFNISNPGWYNLFSYFQALLIMIFVIWSSNRVEEIINNYDSKIKILEKEI